VSREIKFRAYDKDKKIMIHNYDQSVGKIYSLPLGSSIRDFVFNLGLSYETLMQYTGLKDKHGKEIFEGDIIKTELWIHYNNSVIRFEHGYFTPFQYDYINGEDLEVVGNVWENGDLLNDNK
jgi:uncharacterized phage protein (TIGR01671 family)